MWEVINRQRNRWRGINRKIRVEEWGEYCKSLLGGVEGRVVQGGEVGRRVKKS